MDGNVDQSWRRQGLLYPTMLIAAIAVIIFSVVGIAAMTGLLPGAIPGYRPVDEVPPPALKRAPRDSPRALDPPHGAAGGPAAAHPATCSDCAVVEWVRTLERKGEGLVLGGGAAAGSLTARDAGEVRTRAAGAGGQAGERSAPRVIYYQVRVRMNDGTHRNHYQAVPPKVVVGQRVRFANGQLLTD